MLLFFALACQTASDPGPTASPGTSLIPSPTPTTQTSQGIEGARVARLSHVQWQNTTTDLLFVADADNLTDDFVRSATASWFENDQDALTVDPTLWLQYQAASEALAADVVADPERLRLIAPVPERDTFLKAFGKRAFRRPLHADELFAFQSLFDAGPEIFETSDAFADGAHAVVAGMLQSPPFIYRKLGFAGPADGLELDDYELASKLSYGLWNTMPDEALMAAADEGLTESRLQQQVERMLADPRAKRMVRDMHRQWLHIDSYQHIERTNEENHAPYFLSTPFAMETEVYDFVDRIVFGSGNVNDLFTSRQTIVESRLADIYGVPGVEGDPFDPYATETPALVPVELDPAERAGLLTLSGFLAWQADGGEPNLINRGAFINAGVLCVDVPAPPPNATPLAFEDDGLTLRERIEAHTSDCGGACHNDYINPIGFAFGNYDAAGSFITIDNDAIIDASGTYTFDDGTASFDNGVALSEMLAINPQVHRCYTSRLLAYTEGRGVTEADEERLDALMFQSLDGDSILDLITAIVMDEAFRLRPTLD